MAQVSWLVTGKRSGRAIVTAPGAGDAQDAVVQVDNALDKFSGPVPRWFRAIERLGYWWYGVCIVVGVAAALALVPAELKWKVAWGVTFGLIATPLTSALFYYLARAQARSAGFPSTAKALADVKDAARPSNGEVRKHVVTVLENDPSLEPQVHRLVWRAAKNDGAARKELEALWEKADPTAAAALSEKAAKVQADIDDLKAQGKI